MMMTAGQDAPWNSLFSAPTAVVLYQTAGVGYVIVARQRLAATGVEIARMRPPRGTSL